MCKCECSGYDGNSDVNFKSKNSDKESKKMVNPKNIISVTSHNLLNSNSNTAHTDEEDIKKMNAGFKTLFNECNRIDKVVHEFEDLGLKRKKLKSKNMKELEDRLHFFVDEIKKMDFDTMNQKLNDLEVDNLFVKEGKPASSKTPDTIVNLNENNQKNRGDDILDKSKSHTEEGDCNASDDSQANETKKDDIIEFMNFLAS